jgi:2-polyprenyl-3-methyl-5-hydroxy-6-metoxy-1,4-benzoquinol methylase
MSFLDRLGTDIRISKARRFIRPNDSILDIGCADGTLFRKLKGVIKPSYGIDPVLASEIKTPEYILAPGMFPEAVPSGMRFDAITMLAVLEHMPEDMQAKLDDLAYDMLNEKGRVIITVPSPKVDHILEVLMKLHLMSDESLEEHHGFDYRETENLFDKARFSLLHKSKFELGLNNLYVFQRN